MKDKKEAGMLAGQNLFLVQAESVDFTPYLPLCEEAFRSQRLKRKPEDRSASIAAELLLRVYLQQVCSIENESIRLAKDDFGKPFIVKGPAVEFNWSHSKTAVVLAVAKKPVGVDVEESNRAITAAFQKRFFAQAEMQSAQSKEGGAVKIWTQKEAFLKWKGSGICKSPALTDVTQEDTARLLKTFSASGTIVSVCSSEVAQFRALQQIGVTDFLHEIQKLT